MRVLSLFDGMACGMLAMQAAGIEVTKYVAFEIDKYAVKTSSHNFPMIEHRGDVFQADFTEFSGFDFLVGGSPCTYWSIAQKNNRETEASGMGWELFSQYVRALREAKPMYFIYENNKSMSKAIRESITQTFGFEPVCINSALVSAQNRQRLYWVGKRNPDGTYSKVHVDQPVDRGILLRDVLDGMTSEPFGECTGKAYALTASYWKGQPKNKVLEKSQRSHAVEPVNVAPDGKAWTLKAQYHKNGVANLLNDNSQGCKFAASGAAEPVRIPEYGSEGKARPIGAKYAPNCGGFWHRMFSDNPNKQQTDMIADPVSVRCRGRQGMAKYEARDDAKSGAITAERVCEVADPCRVGTFPNESKNQSHDSQQYRIYSTDAKGVTLCGNGGGMGAKTGLYSIPVATDLAPFVLKKFDDAVEKYGYIPEMYNPYNNAEITDKHPTLTAQCNQQTASSSCFVFAYAIPCEWDEDGNPTKAVSVADGKTYTVYQVIGGQITIKGKQYPIKLADGFYIIRKLTVSECKRLQTVPEWYEFPVSDTQAYKMLGNGWTVEVIAHLIDATMAEADEEEQLDLFAVGGVADA